MRIEIENTGKIVNVNGIDCRLWKGKSETGVDVIAFIPRIAQAQFERELQKTRQPSFEAQAFPARMVL